MPQINAAALGIIKGAEGCRLSAYPDPGTGADPVTIGYGATGAGIHMGLVWTQAQCDARLQQDVGNRGDQVAHVLAGVATTGNQFGAMVSLAYNIGIGNFGSSSVLRFHKAGDHHSAGLAFASWNKGGGRVLPGLVRRRAAEAALYLTGVAA